MTHIVPISYRDSIGRFDVLAFSGSGRLEVVVCSCKTCKRRWINAPDGRTTNVMCIDASGVRAEYPFATQG
jgi:hypothetical protein